MALLDRIDREVAAGRPWRAKEIVGGNMSNAWPHAGVVERYGQILLSLGDQLERGGRCRNHHLQSGTLRAILSAGAEGEGLR